MKHIRNILLLITIIFAFVMQAEVYQNKLVNFGSCRFEYSVTERIINKLSGFFRLQLFACDDFSQKVCGVVSSSMCLPFPALAAKIGVPVKPNR